jgi:hypothetical protein
MRPAVGARCNMKLRVVRTELGVAMLAQWTEPPTRRFQAHATAETAADVESALIDLEYLMQAQILPDRRAWLADRARAHFNPR